MSTRTQIKVKGSPVYIYKHHDGYPDYILKVLQPMLKKHLEERGNDIEYAVANIMKVFAIEEYDLFKEQKMAGYGVGIELHGDIDYLYLVDLNEKSIIVQRPIYKEFKIQGFKVYKTVSIIN